MKVCLRKVHLLLKVILSLYSTALITHKGGHPLEIDTPFVHNRLGSYFILCIEI